MVFADGIAEPISLASLFGSSLECRQNHFSNLFPVLFLKTIHCPPTAHKPVSSKRWGRGQTEECCPLSLPRDLMQYETALMTEVIS